RRDAAVHRAVHADAVHGRGVGRRYPLAVLHQPPGGGPGARRGGRAAARVRRPRLDLAGTRSAGPGLLPALEAGLVRAVPPAAPADARVLPAADRASEVPHGVIRPVAG